MFLWYCQEGAAGVEFRQLQSSQGIVSAWALAAPELDADETLSPKPSCIGPGTASSEPSSPTFIFPATPPPPLFPLLPQQQTPYRTLPLPFTSFRPLEFSHPLHPRPSHCNALALYRWRGVLHSITLHSFTLYNKRLLPRYYPSSTCAWQSLKPVQCHDKFWRTVWRVASLKYPQNLSTAFLERSHIARRLSSRVFLTENVLSWKTTEL